MNEDEENNLDFSQYIPNWKGEDQNESVDWYFEEGFEKAIENPEAYIDEKNEVKWRHVVKAGNMLKQQNNNFDGPYSHEQVSQIVFQIVLEEALDSLVEKKLIKKNDNGTYELTEEGFNEVEEIKERHKDKEE